MNPSQPTAPETPGSPRQAETASRAHAKWVAHGKPSGTDRQDWREAEAETRELRVVAGHLAEIEERLTRQIADRRQAEQRLAAEHAVSRILALSSSLDDAAPGILRAICESLNWDFGEVWEVDGTANLLRCAAIWHIPQTEFPAFEQDTRQRTFAPGFGIPGRVWASEGLIWVPDVAADDDLPRAAVAAQEGLHGAVGFPLRRGNDFLGVIGFFSREVRRPDEELIAMMASIGSQISQFIERRHAEDEVRRQSEQRRIAQEIQQGLLPKAMPAFPGFTVSGKLTTANEVGGDCFDLIPHVVEGREHLLVLIADASGHGIAAALLMAETRAYLRALALTGMDIGALLALTNRRLADEIVSGHFVTLLLVQLDPRSRSLLHSSAGHCPGYVLDRQGRPKAMLESTGIPLGVQPASPYPAGPRISLEPGERVFLYTDGIVEASSPEGVLFGADRMLEILRTHRQEAPDDVLAVLPQGRGGLLPLPASGRPDRGDHRDEGQGREKPIVFSARRRMISAVEESRRK
jgi:serine phosphatase RsbU (regulator of sigma subunit)